MVKQACLVGRLIAGCRCHLQNRSKRKGAERPAVVACTLLPYDAPFELGGSLAESSDTVSLNHPHCAKFCVLGGAACSR